MSFSAFHLVCPEDHLRDSAWQKALFDSELSHQPHTHVFYVRVTMAGARVSVFSSFSCEFTWVLRNHFEDRHFEPAMALVGAE